MRKSKLNINMKDLVLLKYEGDMIIKDIAEEMGASRSSIQRFMANNGIVARSNGEVHRKYLVDEDFFEAIDSEEKAYWLGFITADGNVYKTYLEIALSFKDREHLFKFLGSIKSNHPICDGSVVMHGKEYKFSKLNFSVKNMVESLNKLGVFSNKSHHVKPCVSIKDGLLKHYWRGIVDGDGWICCHRSKNGQMYTRIGLCGNKFIIKGFLDFVRNNGVKYKSKKIEKQGSIYRVVFTGINQASMIARILYNESSVFLDRKRDKAHELLRITR